MLLLVEPDEGMRQCRTLILLQRANLYTPMAYHSYLFQLSKNIQPAAQMHFS